jgi:hypothetical protein
MPKYFFKTPHHVHLGPINSWLAQQGMSPSTRHTVVLAGLLVASLLVAAGVLTARMRSGAN